MENIGAKLVRQAAAKTNDLAGDGTTTSVVLAQGLIAEGVKVCFVSIMFLCVMFTADLSVSSNTPTIFQVVAAGANPVLITRGIEKTTKALVSELKSISKEVWCDCECYGLMLERMRITPLNDGCLSWDDLLTK